MFLLRELTRAAHFRASRRPLSGTRTVTAGSFALAIRRGNCDQVFMPNAAASASVAANHLVGSDIGLGEVRAALPPTLSPEPRPKLALPGLPANVELPAASARKAWPAPFAFRRFRLRARVIHSFAQDYNLNLQLCKLYLYCGLQAALVNSANVN